MARRIKWAQLLLAWLPIWGVFAALLVGAHGALWHSAILLAFRMVLAACVLGIGVWRITLSFPWPKQVRPPFVVLHIGLALVYSVAWLVLNSTMYWARHGMFTLSLGPGAASYLSAGVWLYVMVAGVSYAMTATERAAMAEASAARSQLAALRSQLHPHFLFNALHTVVQLIPIEPKRAAQAAEQLAALLRRTIEDDRDLVPLSEEWDFVERYLELERIRFGDRLLVHSTVPSEAHSALIPLFALQTLVENAVRHGAAPKVEPTNISVVVSLTERTLTIVVSDNGVGASAGTLAASAGTGLRRLRERLDVLYAGKGRLDVSSPASAGFVATLVVPRAAGDE